MRNFIYNCWKGLKLILSAIALLISILSSYSWYENPGRIELLIFCILGILTSIHLLTEDF